VNGPIAYDLAGRALEVVLRSIELGREILAARQERLREKLANERALRAEQSAFFMSLHRQQMQATHAAVHTAQTMAVEVMRVGADAVAKAANGAVAAVEADEKANG